MRRVILFHWSASVVILGYLVETEEFVMLHRIPFFELVYLGTRVAREMGSGEIAEVRGPFQCRLARHHHKIDVAGMLAL